MYNKILKNNQVYIGNAFEIKAAYMPGGRIIQRTMEEQACAAEEEDPEAIIYEAREEAKYQADLIIKEAKLEADRILKEARLESLTIANTIEQEARDTGFQKGYIEGMEKYENLIMDAENIKSKAEAEYDEFTRSIEETSVRMILDIAKKVISDELKINRENILLIVRQAFARCTNKSNAILTVSNDDYDYIISNKDKLTALLGGIDDFEIRKDLTLSNGSCLVETQFGTVDAGVDTKLKKIQEEFERLMNLKEQHQS